MISLNDYQTVKNFGQIQYLVEFVIVNHLHLLFVMTGTLDAK